MNKHLLILSCILLLFLGHLSAQGNPFGVVRHVDGSEFGILRNGELKEYSISVDDVSDLIILEGDIVQTGDNSFLEIQFFPSLDMIKLAENTILSIYHIGEDGGGGYSLLFGRVRARVSLSEDSEPFNLDTQHVRADTRSADFGFDYIPTQGSILPTSAVYSFDGNVDVVSTLVNGRSNTLILEPNEAFQVDPVLFQQIDPEFLSLTKERLPGELAEYWRAHPFKFSPSETGAIISSDIAQNAVIASKEAGEEASVIDNILSNPSIGGEAANLGTATGASEESTEEVSFSPLIDPINMTDLLQSLTNPEVSSAETEVWSVLGGIFGVLGAATTITGGFFSFLGPDLPLDPALAQGLGTGFLIGGGTILGTGVIMLIINGLVN